MPWLEERKFQKNNGGGGGIKLINLIIRQEPL